MQSLGSSIPRSIWCQHGSGVSQFLMPVDFWFQHSSGASTVLLSADFLVLEIYVATQSALFSLVTMALVSADF